MDETTSAVSDDNALNQESARKRFYFRAARYSCLAPIAVFFFCLLFLSVSSLFHAGAGLMLFVLPAGLVVAMLVSLSGLGAGFVGLYGGKKFSFVLSLVGILLSGGLTYSLGGVLLFVLMLLGNGTHC